MTEEASAVRRGYPLLAWLVIAGVVGFILWRQVQPTTRGSGAQQVPLLIQGRYLVGLARVGLPGIRPAQLIEQAEALLDAENRGQQVRIAILAGELIGPEEARDRLRSMAPEDEVERLLLRQYEAVATDAEAEVLSAEEQATVRRRLGWFGDLALGPAGSAAANRERALAPARRTLIGYGCFLVGGFAALGVGGFLLVLMGTLTALGHLRSGVEGQSGRGGIWAETFAAYMVVYLGLSAAARYVPVAGPAMWLNGLAMLLSLAALGWPMLRGVSWKEMRQDLGMHRGQGVWRELLVGLGTYVTAIPLLLVGLMVMLGLMYLTGKGRGGMSSGAPTHPIVGVALQTGWSIWLQVFVLAAVLAPVVEEIMFRGVLYRHLRESSSRWGGRASVVLSVATSSVLFAVIHPQGWLAVPVLSMLAVVFSLAREWRGTLIPCMVAHGVNNGVTTLMLLLMAG